MHASKNLERKELGDQRKVCSFQSIFFWRRKMIIIEHYLYLAEDLKNAFKMADPSCRQEICHK